MNIGVSGLVGFSLPRGKDDSIFVLRHECLFLDMKLLWMHYPGHAHVSLGYCRNADKGALRNIVSVVRRYGGPDTISALPSLSIYHDDGPLHGVSAKWFDKGALARSPAMGRLPCFFPPNRTLDDSLESRGTSTLIAGLRGELELSSLACRTTACDKSTSWHNTRIGSCGLDSRSSATHNRKHGGQQQQRGHRG